MAREIFKMNDNTYSIEDDFVRAFVIVGESKAAVIDSGVSGAGFLDLVRQITDKELVLINTHGDRDHTSGTLEFSQIHIMEADYKSSKMAETFPDCKPCFLHDGDSFDLGGRTLLVIEIPGHTRGSIALLDKENRILIAGDSVQTGEIYMFGGQRDIERFESSLEKLMKRNAEYDVVYASHGRLELPKEYVSYVLADWQDYLAGKLDGEPMDLFGMQVKCMKGQHCGFLVQ